MIRILRIAGIALAMLVVAVALWWRLLPVNPAVAFGGILWLPVDKDDFWVPPSLRLAMRKHPPVAKPGKLMWKTLAPGFEAGELPVLAQNMEVDRILLARIDPKRFRFAVRNASSGHHNIDDWTRDLCSLLVVNGSYFDPKGLPATPVLSDGHALGPAKYTASQGAFVATDGKAAIVDLAETDWHKAFKGARDAMVSYPMLLTADGANKAPRGTGWLANRSFLGQDKHGSIIIGTTKSAYFSLDRLGDFLKIAPLDLKLALNLDGGPVACQSVTLNGFDRRTCGFWEMQVDRDGHAKVLPPLRLTKPPLPMALAVLPRDPKTRRCR